MKYIQNRLAAIIDDEGLTQAQLSVVSKVNASTISHLATGSNTSPTPATMKKIIDGLNALREGNKYSRDSVFVQHYNAPDEWKGNKEKAMLPILGKIESEGDQ